MKESWRNLIILKSRSIEILTRSGCNDDDDDNNDDDDDDDDDDDNNDVDVG